MILQRIHHNLKQSFLIAATALITVACSRTAPQEVFAPNGKAINGYDPVAFFTEQKPVKGAGAFTYQWKGAEWQFTSQQNLDAFKNSPEQYAPQYGGYCAYGTAEGHKAPTKAETWTIENGKLYFNYDLDVKNEWNKDRPGYINKADENWPTVKNEK